MRREILVFFALALFLGGCSTVGSTLEGQYYLHNADYAGGRSAFSSRLAENPDDPALNYYMARFELGANNPAAALPCIQKSVRLAPDNAEYWFWAGVTWWGLKQPDKEKSAYEKALALKPDHVAANLYLGHNLLDRGANAAALGQYERVLRLEPDEPRALFNKAVALERLGRIPEMQSAAHAYLDRYPASPLARQGTQMLNKAGDFSWRNHVLGLRTMALRAVAFKPGTPILTEAGQATLDVVGTVLAGKQDLNLHVVVYVQGNPELARQRALAIRDYVSRAQARVSPRRLTPSWLGQAETIQIEGRTSVQRESVAIFTKVK